jgi:hypothetical protein
MTQALYAHMNNKRKRKKIKIKKNKKHKKKRKLDKLNSIKMCVSQDYQKSEKKDSWG